MRVFEDPLSDSGVKNVLKGNTYEGGVLKKKIRC